MKTLLAMFCVAAMFCLFSSIAPPVTADDQPAPAAKPAPDSAKIKDLISRGGYAYHLRDYDRSLALSEEVLKIDPQNSGGLQLKQMSVEAIAKRSGMTWNELKTDQQERLLDTVRHDQTPGPAAAGAIPQGLRQPRPGDPDGMFGPARQVARDNAPILAKLEKTTNVDFKEASLAQVAQFLSTAGNVNVVVDPNASINNVKAADATVTFSARDIKLVNALKWVCRTTGLHYTIRDQVVFITTQEGLEPFKVTAVYDVSDLVAPIPDFNSEVYFNMNLGAVDVRRLFNWYSAYPYWYYQDYRSGMGPLPFAGPFAVGGDSVDRQRLTQPDLDQMINDLIESEEGK